MAHASVAAAGRAQTAIATFGPAAFTPADVLVIRTAATLLQNTKIIGHCDWRKCMHEAEGKQGCK